jgi:hypothetical protein
METTTTFIPQLGDLVIYQTLLWRVVRISLGGKCTLRKYSNTRRLTKGVTADISEITKY